MVFHKAKSDPKNCTHLVFTFSETIWQQNQLSPICAGKQISETHNDLLSSFYHKTRGAANGRID